MPLPEQPKRLEIGKGRIIREGKTVAILSLGTRLAEAEKAADELEAKGLSTTVADLRFAKPLDGELIRRLLTTHEVAVTIEEAAIGGLGAHVLTLASDEGLVDAGLKVRTMRLPDRFQEAIDRAAMRAGLHGDDAYLAEWRRKASPCGDDLEAEADAAAARIDAEYSPERVQALVERGGAER